MRIRVPAEDLHVATGPFASHNGKRTELETQQPLTEKQAIKGLQFCVYCPNRCAQNRTNPAVGIDKEMGLCVSRQLVSNTP